MSEWGGGGGGDNNFYGQPEMCDMNKENQQMLGVWICFLAVTVNCVQVWRMVDVKTSWCFLCYEWDI